MNRIAIILFVAGILFTSIFPVSASAFQCADVTEIPTSECEALQDLYNSTNGANWNDNTGWLADNTPCDWFGVSCRAGQVISINLSNNSLQGNLPETIGNFRALDYLNLNGNALAGSIPASIGQLTVLDQLRLGDNQLTTIPDAVGGCSALSFLDLGKNQISTVPSQIGALSNLTYLKLSSNQLTSASFPAEFSHLTALETLDLFENSLTSLPTSVCELTNLKGINLGWNKPLESLAGIGKMTGLENLYLHSTELTALPEEIASLTKLKVLWLKGNLFTQFPSVVTQFTQLETLLLTYNQQMSGKLPLSLVNLTKMKEFAFDGTALCVPDDAALQAWLAGITTMVSSGKKCAAAGAVAELEKSMKVMRMLTGHEGTCTDLDADGSGKVAAGDAMLALRKAANISDMTCGEGWTTIGDIPEFSFSSEPLIDENTAFIMNVDPFDQLMLTAVTTNGWTIRYFALKDKMGAPVVFTGIHAKKDGASEYFEMNFDGEGYPFSIKQQNEKKVLLNWKNCTIYGEKEWTVTSELPDFSSVPSPVIDKQSQVVNNTDPSDPLWITVTTNDGWVIKYFAAKDAAGAATALSFVQAEEIAGENIIKTKIDGYGYPVKVSVNDGKIVTYDWTLHEIRTEDGMLQPPAAVNVLRVIAGDSASSSSVICAKGFTLLNIACNALGFIPGAGGVVAGGLCGLGTSATGVGVCGSSSSPELDQCLIMAYIASTVGGVALGAAFAATGVGATVSVPVSSIVSGIGNIAGQLYCKKKYGSSSGDPHLRTFDGLGYDFQAVGEFVYIQSTEDPTEMTVQIRQEPARRDSKLVAWNTAVAMSVGGDIVEINGRNNPPVSINHTPTPMENNEIVQLQNGCKIYAENQWRYWVIWKDNSMVNVRFHDMYFAVTTSLSNSRKGLVRGLLGNSDGDKTNDLQTKDGSTTFDVANKLTKNELYNQFGNSWRISQEESLFTYAEGKNTATYTDLNFPYALVTADDLSETVYNNAKQICLDAGITDPILLQDCILDVGVTGDSTFADNMKYLTPPDQSITVTDDWLLYEDAQKTEGEKIIHITADAAWQTGMALREGALNLDGSFEKTFTIYMGDNDNGADGMVFIMLPELTPAGASLNGGEGLGFSSACNNKPCLGVEIDTYRNSFDPSEDHVALINNGSVNHNSTENAGLPVTPLTFNIEDDATHTLTVSWNKAAQVFSVVLDGTTVITHEGLDIKTLLGTSTASYGFVGATGTATSEQYFYPVMMPQ